MKIKGKATILEKQLSYPFLQFRIVKNVLNYKFIQLRQFSLSLCNISTFINTALAPLNIFYVVFSELYFFLVSSLSIILTLTMKKFLKCSEASSSLI